MASTTPGQASQPIQVKPFSSKNLVTVAQQQIQHRRNAQLQCIYQFLENASKNFTADECVRFPIRICMKASLLEPRIIDRSDLQYLQYALNGDESVWNMEEAQQNGGTEYVFTPYSRSDYNRD